MDDTSVNITNTTSSSTSDNWSLPPGFAVFALIAGGILNSSLLVTFIRRRTLRNSFGVYLMNLLIIDTTLVFIHGPFNLIDKYSANWYLGRKGCAFLNHLGFTYQNLIIMAHFLIALNRVWAVVFPFSYRTRHSMKVAILLCISPWVFLNIVNIPVVITTTILTPGATNGTLKCNLDTDVMGVWGPITEILFFDLPMLVVILAYPVVCYHSFFSDRKQKVAPQLQSGYHTGVATAHGSHMGTASATAPEGEVTAGRLIVKSKSISLDHRVRLCGRVLHGSATGFVTLTLMTLSVIICLMPKEAYYTWIMFSSYDPPGMNAVADVLERLTTVFDPILVVLGNSELRKMVLIRIRRCCN